MARKARVVTVVMTAYCYTVSMRETTARGEQCNSDTYTADTNCTVNAIHSRGLTNKIGGWVGDVLMKLPAVTRLSSVTWIEFKG